MAITIYLDESGCLGWKLDAPYQRGGSSRHFTLAAAIIPDGRESILTRPVRGLYTRRKRPLCRELKSVELSSGERVGFAHELVKIRSAHAGVHFVAITVRKENVSAAFRNHPNGLYNYMAKLLLLDVMAESDSVCFIPDARSLKTELKHVLHDYLRTELAIRGATTQLQTTPWESKDSLALQFVDILAGIVWAHHEFRNCQAHRIGTSAILQKRLFF
ncbi:DUF3800 domain-containing protein [Cupriavidus gilardii]|uniref:DUF3800 domain-containing protein n=1 Tax=Cupriavidus gilardii TaxID=82541 RepID=A0A849BDM4_9BURK|nr:DUF3800 domain-containing protein [Cupriavidus gilardii]KAB0594831.1 DUF3800 domain-containing protein [Cupriavidus gilardii]MCT9014291.1 DUF3800 domain-containing protein [Cupriavidus gilardii]MCT9054011.1 DUF3800 domain-containing protein [Cupriavidus gilardii]NNH13990.1 DUF3800 domain-containing protein [Cupriavidus gilardii]WNG68559.1 DUF3800 domain-containing protein [Cupriavidus gilardii]